MDIRYILSLLIIYYGIQLHTTEKIIPLIKLERELIWTQLYAPITDSNSATQFISALYKTILPKGQKLSTEHIGRFSPQIYIHLVKQFQNSNMQKKDVEEPIEKHFFNWDDRLINQFNEYAQQNLAAIVEWEKQKEPEKEVQAKTEESTKESEKEHAKATSFESFLYFILQVFPEKSLSYFLSRFRSFTSQPDIGNILKQSVFARRFTVSQLLEDSLNEKTISLQEIYGRIYLDIFKRYIESKFLHTKTQGNKQ